MQRIYSNILFQKISVLDKMKWDQGDQHSLKHFCDYWFKSCNKGSRRYVFPIFGFITCNGYILTYYFQKFRSRSKIKRVRPRGPTFMETLLRLLVQVL